MLAMNSMSLFVWDHTILLLVFLFSGFLKTQNTFSEIVSKSSLWQELKSQTSIIGCTFGTIN